MDIDPKHPHKDKNRDIPFRIQTDKPGWRKAVVKAGKPMIERLLRFPELNDLHRTTQDLPEEKYVATRMLEALKVHVVVKDDYLAQIPTEGPLVIVANHPFGGIEGIVLADVLRRVRPDVKLLTNEMLKMVPELSDDMIAVNVFGSKEATAQNSRGLREAMRWIKDGHCLGIFPAGEVSHLKISHRRIADPEWNPQIARIIQRTGATVVPIFFEGRNSVAFQLAGLVHPRLRTVMLPTEMMKRRGRRIRLRIGRPISPERIAKFESPNALNDFLRVRTYLLKRKRQQAIVDHPNTYATPIAPPIDSSLIAEEMAHLPLTSLMLTSGDLEVHCLNQAQAPHTMQDIGRLREICFRAVGEGTGKPRDIDKFDTHYWQLIIWDTKNHAIAGGYRLGKTDEILQQHGIKGLYVHTLFDLSTHLLEQLGPCLEMGRSWVHPDYQKALLRSCCYGKALPNIVCAIHAIVIC